MTTESKATLLVNHLWCEVSILWTNVQNFNLLIALSSNKSKRNFVLRMELLFQL